MRIPVRHVGYSLMLLVVATSWQPCHAKAQTDAGFVESEDTHYYDFWPGTWVQVVDGVVDTSATTFTVRRSVNSAAFHETWRQVYDGRSRQSVGLRSWDQVNGRWMFVWVSDNALFQVWEGQRIEDQWYMVKEFEVDGEVFLSRQSWIPTGDDQLTRTIERSTDGGRTWVVRIRESYRRAGD